MRRPALGMLPLCLALTACGAEDTTLAADESGNLTAEQLSQGFGDTWGDRFSEDEKVDGLTCSGIRVPDQSGFNKRIALTFDDGPLGSTEKVMEILREFEAPATFFVMGSRARTELGRRLIPEMKADPLFIVGNHSYSHPNFRTIGADEVSSQLDRTTSAILDAGGEQPTYFRFPYGSSNCSTAQAVRSRGMHITGWHVDSADWCFNAGNGYCSRSTFEHVPDHYRDDMVGFVLQQARSSDGGVLLFHDVHGYTANNLRSVLQTLKDDGFTFVGLDDELTFPRLNGIDPESLPFVGDLCESDEDCAFGGGFCHPVGFCTQGCAGYCPDQAGKATTFCVEDPTAEREDGICVSQATAVNSECEDLPGTVYASAERYVGDSGRAVVSRLVCLPDPAQ